ncbi:MAG: hypothetical protein GY820_44250 [Gammaproteobacteria bacterium]|nr:hypothetical protein [Gammaproteobacteria bacterium]
MHRINSNKKKRRCVNSHNHNTADVLPIDDHVDRAVSPDHPKFPESNNKNLACHLTKEKSRKTPY